MNRRILLTSALPYANGDIHLGHLVEYIQADIWSRFQKLRGHECWFVCADDAHGTPIMLRAEQEGIPPEQLITAMQAAHERDFAGFNIAFDHYHSTHSEENRVLSEEIFAALKAKGYIVERDIEQLYDPQKEMFLPDRYVRGDCPRCGAADQYGDSCEVCGGVYAPTELKNPRSALSGARPEMRASQHYFLRLAGEEDALRQWMSEEIATPGAPAGTPATPRLQREAANKLGEWLKDGLRDWDVSRDAPYFGFRIPDAPGEKYFYVWLDAPIGYMASFRHFCDTHDVSFDDFWLAGSAQETELYHFIGKDILYFHGLFWPTMLANSGYRRPTRLFAHGFLSVNGEKMSKSRGTFITAARYLGGNLKPDALRYYYACKLNDRIEDIDLNLADFALRVNGDLVGKLFNIPSRTAGFIHKLFDGRLDDAADATLTGAQEIAAAYERRRYQDAMRLLMQETDALNAEIDAAKPWLLAKDDSQREALHALCSRALRRFHLLITALSPVLPALAADAAKFLNCGEYHWGEAGINALPAGHAINPYPHLMKRMEEKDINALIDTATAKSTAKDEKPAAAPAQVSIDEFGKMELRVAVVTAAESVEGADKLLRLQLDVGEAAPRQVFAGIKKHYEPADLTGRRVVVLANLAPRKMRFGVSEGMVLAAEDGNGNVVLLQPAGDAPAGTRIR